MQSDVFREDCGTERLEGKRQSGRKRDLRNMASDSEGERGLSEEVKREIFRGDRED